MKHLSKLTILTLLSLLAPLLQCITAGDPERKLADIPESSGFSDWAEVFRSPARIRDFRVFHTGEVEVPVQGMLNRELNEDESSTMFVDVYAFWFCHDEHGCFMIDSGLDTSFGEGKPGNVHGLMADSYIISSRQKPGTDILSYLSQKDRKSRLQGIFFTHLHGDHSSGIPAISSTSGLEDLNYYVAEDETYVNYWLLYQGDHLENVSELNELSMTNAMDMPILGPCLDVFGDGSLWAIQTSGHSPRHLSYLLMTSEGPVLLTGDASHTREGFEQGIEPGWVSDRDEAKNSLEKLKAFSNKYPNVRVIFGHQR